MYYATMFDNDTLMKILIEMKKKFELENLQLIIEKQNKDKKISILHLACMKNNFEIVNYLLGLPGVDVNLQIDHACFYYLASPTSYCLY